MSTNPNSNFNATSNWAYATYLKRYSFAEKKADNILFYDDKSETYRKAHSSEEYYDILCENLGDCCA